MVIVQQMGGQPEFRDDRYRNREREMRRRLVIVKGGEADPPPEKKEGCDRRPLIRLREGVDEEGKPCVMSERARK